MRWSCPASFARPRCGVAAVRRPSGALEQLRALHVLFLEVLKGNEPLNHGLIGLEEQERILAHACISGATARYELLRLQEQHGRAEEQCQHPGS